MNRSIYLAYSFSYIKFRFRLPQFFLVFSKKENRIVSVKKLHLEK